MEYIFLTCMFMDSVIWVWQNNTFSSVFLENMAFIVRLLSILSSLFTHIKFHYHLKHFLKLIEINIASISHFIHLIISVTIHIHHNQILTWMSPYFVFMSDNILYLYRIVSVRRSCQILNPIYLTWKIDLTLCGNYIITFDTCDNIMLNDVPISQCLL